MEESGDSHSSAHVFLAPVGLPYACAGRGQAAGRRNVASWRDRMGLNIRAVFFDLDNTLIDTAGASRKGMMEVTSAYPQPSSGWSQCALPGIARSPASLSALSPLHLRSAGCQMIDPSEAPGPLVFPLRPPYPKERDRRTTGLGRLPSL